MLMLVVIIVVITVLVAGISGDYHTGIQNTENNHKIDLIDIINKFEITEFKRFPADGCVYIRGNIRGLNVDIDIKDVHVLWCNRTIIVTVYAVKQRAES